MNVHDYTNLLISTYNYLVHLPLDFLARDFSLVFYVKLFEHSSYQLFVSYYAEPNQKLLKLY